MRTSTTIALSLLAACLASGCAIGDVADPMTTRTLEPSYGDSGPRALDGGPSTAGDAGAATPPPTPVPVDGGVVMPPPAPPPSAGPTPLLCGRTYDQQLAYFTHTGDVSVVSLGHRDGTTLPADEGGGSCGSTCTEQVTRIANGASISGVFTGMSTFSIQGASSSEGGVGTAIIDVCGVRLPAFPLYAPGTGTPGFNNLPSPGHPVPVDATCTFTITATGGYIDVRAVTTACPSGPTQPFG